MILVDGESSLMEIDSDETMRNTMSGLLDGVEVMRRQTVMIKGWNGGELQVSDQWQLDKVAIGQRTNQLMSEQNGLRQAFQAHEQRQYDELHQMQQIAAWYKGMPANNHLSEQVYANAVKKLGDKAWEELY